MGSGTCWCPLCGLSLPTAAPGGESPLYKHLNKSHLSDKQRAYLLAKAVAFGVEWDTARRQDATLET